MIRTGVSVLWIFLYIRIISVETLPRRSVDICHSFSNQTHCYYFACIDSIYQCGEKNILVQFSYKLCVATLERTLKSLTRAGQLWANTAQTCLMQQLNYFLETTPTVTCTDIDRYILNQYPICLTESHPIYSLCTIVCNNLEVFFQIFQNWNIENLNLNRLLLETAQLCPEDSQMEYIIDLGQANIRTIFWSLCLDSLQTKFENFDPTEAMLRIFESDPREEAY